MRYRILAFFLAAALFLLPAFPVLGATKAEIDTLAAHFPASWPAAPEIASESAVLIELNSGTMVYAKNPTRSMYPASTTKLLTAYLTLLNCQLDEVITYSSRAILSLEPGSSHIGLRPGESLTVEDSLFGLLLPSANEVANGLAEHISGSVSAFASLMNDTAASLGCVNTNFTNANGLHDPNHMTCAYDLCVILRACLQLRDFVRIASSRTHVRPADELLDKEIPMATTNLFMKKDSEFYDPTVVCGKTGWTEQAGRCLVTYAVRGDLDLICAVMNSESPNQYNDTQLLLNYAERGFTTVRPSDQDPQLNPQRLRTDSPLGLAENTVSLLELDSSARILLPNSCSFSDLTKKISAAEDGTRTITYRLDGYPLGSASILTETSGQDESLRNPAASSSALMSNLRVGSLHTINIWLVLTGAAALILLICLLFLTFRYLQAPHDPPVREEDHHLHFL